MKTYLIAILILFPLTITSPRTGDIIVVYNYIVNEATYLVRVINSEAIGQSYEEKLRTGSVVLNRVNNSKFPNTIEGVVCQENQFSGIDSEHFIVDNNTAKGRESIRAAHYLLKHGSILPANVLYFHNPKTGTNKKWMKKLRHKLFLKGDVHWYFSH